MKTLYDRYAHANQCADSDKSDQCGDDDQHGGADLYGDADQLNQCEQSDQPDHRNQCGQHLQFQCSQYGQASSGLIYISTDAIKWYCEKNPIIWPDVSLANGKDGNKQTPVPAMKVFWDLLTARRGLFTQKEYVDYAWNQPEWKEWSKTLTEEEIRGVGARLYRNFYPSAIDSLYVWALLSESKIFHVCNIDIVSDVEDKIDLKVWISPHKSIPIALKGCQTKENYRWSKVKENRGNPPQNIFNAYIPWYRLKSPGNKRWYEISDFDGLINKAKEEMVSRN